MSLPGRVSIAIPLYNEEDVVPELLRRVRSVLDGLAVEQYEVVLVDDGSTDGTRKLLEREAAADDRLIVVCLSRNFGHQTAITAALDHVTGDATVVMDGDLQDPPEAIPELLAKHAEGYDVVYARRVSRAENWLLRFCYFAFYRLLSLLSDTRIPLDSGDFALLSRRVVEAIRQAPERQRFVRGLRAWVGFPQIGISVERTTRAAGKPKYTPKRLLELAFDGIFSFSTVPLRLAVILGALAMAASIAYAAFAVYARFFLDQSPPGFTALIVAIVFSSGVQLVLLGVLGEYVGRIYAEVKARPHYIVDRVIRGG